MENKERPRSRLKRLLLSNKVYKDFALKALRNKLLMLLGDIYCCVWDVTRAKYESREAKNEAHRIALNKVALASIQCERIIAEMEAR